ncbi:hypothetical protein [Acuticoccus sp.]|uniref:hypothetical protein n=1 Tax=Acuticoccus sp. TaxID=1904378 RepID=UPI003B51FB4E
MPISQAPAIVALVLMVGVVLAVPFAAQGEVPTPLVVPASAEPTTRDARRVFVDTEVAQVMVDDERTIAILAPSPASPCPSDEYVIERDAPKWLFETGRLLVAQEQAAIVRVSFSCAGGLQTINAIQFLSPPGQRMATGTPSRARVVRGRASPAGVPRPRPAEGAIPTPASTTTAAGDVLTPPLPLPTAPDVERPLPTPDGVRRVPLP